MFRKLIGAFVGLATVLCVMGQSSTAVATPFRVDFVLSPLLTGDFQYDFTLTLDNNDGSWSLGQQFDWFSFGNQTDAGASGGAFGTWTWLSSPSGFFRTASSGGANGPTLCWGATSCSFSDGGYVPTFVGQSISWSGFSSIDLSSNGILWSNLTTSGPNFAIFASANNLTAPEPSTLALFATGLGLLAFLGWRRRGAAWVKAA